MKNKRQAPQRWRRRRGEGILRLRGGVVLPPKEQQEKNFFVQKNKVLLLFRLLFPPTKKFQKYRNKRKKLEVAPKIYFFFEPKNLMFFIHGKITKLLSVFFMHKNLTLKSVQKNKDQNGVNFAL